MDRILVEVFCPATSRSYDFWVPKKMTVETATEKICEDICLFEHNNRLFGPLEETLLCSKLVGKALFRGDTLEASGIRGGDQLVVL